MSLIQWIDKAGDFPVIKNPCPYFGEMVNLSDPPAGVLHTTEGDTEDGALAVFKRHYAPHFVVGPNIHDKSKMEIEQLVPIGHIGAACVTHNDRALVQIEAVGRAKQTPWMFDDLTAAALAALMKTLFDLYHIPLTRPWPDGVYGMARANDPHRNGGQFGKIAGWYGHGDVPSPDSHWDPGNLQWSKLFERARALG